MSTEKIADAALASSDKAKQKKNKGRPAWQPQSILARKTDALRNVMERTDRVISQRRDLTVRLTPINPAGSPLPNPKAPGNGIPDGTPAWTDGKVIHLNRKRIEEELARPNLDMHKFIRLFKGTNYHELGHVIFTPRNNSPFHRSLVAESSRLGEQFWKHYMGLEDQRMETMYTSLYDATSPYFVAAALRWLLSDVAKYAGAYPLIYGRKYLDPNLRAMCRKAMVEALVDAKQRGVFKADNVEGWVRRMEQLTDQYIAIDPNTDPNDAMDVLRKYHAHFQNAQVQQQEGGCGTTSEKVSKSQFSKSKPDTGDTEEAKQRADEKKEEQDDEFEKAKEDVEQGKPDKADEDDESDDKGAGDESDDEEESDDDGAGDGDADDDLDDDDDEDGEEDGDDAGSKGSGKSDSSESDDGTESGDSDEGGDGATDGLSDVPHSAEQDLQDMLEEAQDDIENDDELNADIESTIKAFKALVSGRESMNIERFDRNLVAAKALDQQASAKMVRTLAALKFDLEPSWLRGEPMGRINMRRALRQKVDPGSLDIFDRWDEGAEDRASVEVVIMLDLSYSMSSLMEQVSRAMWILKMTFDKCEIPTTCLGFSEGVTMLFGANEKVPRSMTPIFGTWGGTRANECVDKAYNILSRSQATNKVLITITDGQWQGEVHKADAKIHELARGGCATVIFGLNRSVTSYGKHGHDIGVDITQVGDVVEVAKRLVESIVRRNRV